MQMLGSGSGTLRDIVKQGACSRWQVPMYHVPAPPRAAGVASAALDQTGRLVLRRKAVRSRSKMCVEEDEKAKREIGELSPATSNFFLLEIMSKFSIATM